VCSSGGGRGGVCVKAERGARTRSEPCIKPIMLGLAYHSWILAELNKQLGLNGSS
jgi:hypothetical protein